MTEPAFTHDSPGTPAHAWRTDPRWATLPALDIPRGVEHLLVVAAHPDDETLGAGALLAHAARTGLRADVVVATLGEASHPHSPTHTRAQLAARRTVEVTAAVRSLAPSAQLHLPALGAGTSPAGVMAEGAMADGALATTEPELAELLAPLVSATTLVVAPWPGDGHPDHAAAGRAAAHAARERARPCWFYPIWFWHWGTPDTAPWERLSRRHVPGPERRARATAAAHHVSQTAPLSDAAGDEVLLSAELLEHFTGDEVFVTDGAERHPREAFEALHAEDADPWGTRHRWYEARKRALTLAALMRPRYGSALELGCSVGTLAAQLAPRCDQLLAVDAARSAIAEAQRVLAPLENVQVRQGAAPGAVPDGPLALIVLSEVGYFLLPLELAETLARLERALARDGELVLCHWRHPVEGWPLDGADVHAMAHRRTSLVTQARYEDEDLLLEVLVHPGRPSVAAVEGVQ